MSLQFGTFPEHVDDTELFTSGDDATLRSQPRLSSDFPQAFEEDSVRRAHYPPRAGHSIPQPGRNVDPYLAHNRFSRERGSSRVRTGLDTRVVDPGVAKINPVTNAPRTKPYDAHSQRRVLVRQNLMEAERLETAAIAAAAERIHSQVNAKLSKLLQPQGAIVTTNNALSDTASTTSSGGNEGILLDDNVVQVKAKMKKVQRCRPNTASVASTGNSAKADPVEPQIRSTLHSTPLQLPTEKANVVKNSKNTNSTDNIELSPSELALVNCLRHVPKLDENGLHAVFLALQSKGSISGVEVPQLLQQQSIERNVEQPTTSRTSISREPINTSTTTTTTTTTANITETSTPSPQITSPTAQKKKMVRPIIQVSLTSPHAAVQQLQEQQQHHNKRDDTFEKLFVQQQQQHQQHQQLIQQMQHHQQQQSQPYHHPVAYLPPQQRPEYTHQEPPITPTTVYVQQSSPEPVRHHAHSHQQQVQSKQTLDESFEGPEHIIDFYNNLGIPIESSRKKNEGTVHHNSTDTRASTTTTNQVHVPTLNLSTISDQHQQQARHARTQSLPSYALPDSAQQRPNESANTATSTTTPNKRPSTGNLMNSSSRNSSHHPPIISSPNTYKRSSNRSTASTTSSATSTPVRSGHIVARAQVNAANASPPNTEKKERVLNAVKYMVEGEDVQRKMERKKRMDEERLSAERKKKQQLEDDKLKAEREKEEIERKKNEDKLRLEREAVEKRRLQLLEQEELDRMRKKKLQQEQEEEEERDRQRKKKLQQEEEERERDRQRKKKLLLEEEEEKERLRRKKQLQEEEEERLRKKKLQQEEEEEERERRRKKKLQEEEEEQERQRKLEALKRQEEEHKMRIEVQKRQEEEHIKQLEAQKRQEEERRKKMEAQHAEIHTDSESNNAQTRGISFTSSVMPQKVPSDQEQHVMNLDPEQKKAFIQLTQKYPPSSSPIAPPPVCEVCEEACGLVFCSTCGQVMCYENDCVRDMHVKSKNHELRPFYCNNVAAAVSMPIAQPAPNRIQATVVASSTSSSLSKKPVCEVCEEAEAAAYCEQCAMFMCEINNCAANMHMTGVKHQLKSL